MAQEREIAPVGKKRQQVIEQVQEQLEQQWQQRDKEVDRPARTAQAVTSVSSETANTGVSVLSTV